MGYIKSVAAAFTSHGNESAEDEKPVVKFTFRTVKGVSFANGADTGKKQHSNPFLPVGCEL